MRVEREIFEAGGVRYDFRKDGERKSAKIVRFGRKIALQTAWLSGFGAIYARFTHRRGGKRGLAARLGRTAAG